jgi:AcrR family transcriptional regulator
VPAKVQRAPTSTRRRRSDGELTRRKVIDAAVQSILENGYYQTSSNKIAKAAGVTWGTLQHQFGTREALMLEVLNDEWARTQETIAVAQARGETLEERLDATMAILSRHYGSATYLALLEILLDLTQDPNTSAETRKAALAHGQRLSRAWQPLFKQALGEAAEDKELVRYAFKALRGYLIGDSISSRLTRAGADKAERRFMIQGIAAAIRAHAYARGIELR